MRMRFPTVALVLLAVPAWAQAPGFPSTTADVVAWNFSGFTAIPVARQAQLVRVLKDLDAEVIAAVEVNPDNVVHDVAAALTEAGVCHEAFILPQTANQNIGVIAKCGARVTNARLVANSDDGNSALRKAFAVDVRLGQFDFLLIVLHLKAGRSTSDRAVRDRQVAHIATFIASATSQAERDVLVVGDYNMIPGADDSNFAGMNPGGVLRYVSSEDLAGQFSHLSSGAGCDDGNLLDGFAVAATHTAEYIEGSLRIYPMHRALAQSLCEFRDNVSDHLPFIARFRVLEDDDGGVAAGSNALRIVAVLPNPDGSDHQAEQVTLRNVGTATVSLADLRIADDEGNEFALSGSITAGQTLVVTLARSAMLNNDGDEVRLVSGTDVLHSVTYTGSQVVSGQTITFP